MYGYSLQKRTKVAFLCEGHCKIPSCQIVSEQVEDGTVEFILDREVIKQQGTLSLVSIITNKSNKHKKLVTSTDLAVFFDSAVVDGLTLLWNNSNSSVLSISDESGKNQPVTNLRAFGRYMEGNEEVSFYIDSEGSIWSYGGDNKGRSGHTDNLPRKFPEKIKSVSNMTFLTVCSQAEKAGNKDGFAMCIDAFGKLYSWGSAAKYQLGHGLCFLLLLFTPFFFNDTVCSGNLEDRNGPRFVHKSHFNLQKSNAPFFFLKLE